MAFYLIGGFSFIDNHNQYGSFITTCYHWYGNKVNLNLNATS